MIKSYNRMQTIKAISLAFGGLVCCFLAYLFFRYVAVFLAWRLNFPLPDAIASGIGILGLAASWVSGYRTWKTRGGLYGYHESGLYHDFGTDSGGTSAVDHYAHRITGPAYLLGQVFMAGPQFILRSLTLLRSRIAHSQALEQKLEQTLATLRTANKWQGLDDYPGLRSEILYLAQMGHIDFSDHNGKPRFKAS